MSAQNQPAIDVAALARLARIEITPAAAARLAEQLPRILDYVGQLQAIPTEAVAVVHQPIPLREDVVAPTAKEERDEILQQAPDHQADFWKVKSVF
jgi:aspartyl/glutamyl-tRNA(Asn/Gln) amidotransferase C subunit